MVFFDIICWIIGITAAILFLTTSATVWLWVAIIFGSIAVLLLLFLATDGFEGSGGGFDFFDL